MRKGEACFGTPPPFRAGRRSSMLTRMRSRDRPGDVVDTGPGVVVRRRRWLSIPGVSARFRILAWCTLLVAGALTASVLATRVVLLRRLSREIDSELTHELDEVAALQRTRVDPQTKRPFADADQLLLAALAQAAPSRTQELVAVSDGRVIGRSPTAPILALESDREVGRSGGRRSRRRTFSTIHTSAGTVRVGRGTGDVAVDHAGRREMCSSPRRSWTASVRRSTRRCGSRRRSEPARSLFAVGLAWLIAGRVLAPVRELEETARSITESDLTHRLVVNGDDELARLAATFNAMLDRVEGAFRSQRQFIDDAGHELRTPITVIRGHLELLGDDPTERAEVRTIVIDELDRMSRMVNDLLLLARAERPDFLRLAEVDIGACTA